MTRSLAVLCLFATLLLAGSLAGGIAAQSQSDETPPVADWRSRESWARLRVGMRPSEVLRILGEPGRITRYYAFTRWEYPDALGRRVNFDERGRLLAWGDRAR